MTTSAALADLIDALEEQSDSLSAFLDRETGEAILISDESLSLAERAPEEIEALPGWQKDEAQLALQVTTTERYLPLPDRFEVDEWTIMRDFSNQVESDAARTALQNAIRGQHAFRRFKDQLRNLNLRNSWDQFRKSAFEAMLRDWCEENGVSLRP